MQYPVLLMPWPPRSTELRRIEWANYVRDPRVGLLIDPATGDPYDDVISVCIRILDTPAKGNLADVDVGEVLELPLIDYLSAETQRVDLGRIPWAELLEFRVKNQPPPLELQGKRRGLPPDFDEVKKFLFEVLEKGPVSELEVIGRAADEGISTTTLREVKERLRIASLKDPSVDYPRTLWRLRMSQAYKLKKRKSLDTKR